MAKSKITIEKLAEMTQRGFTDVEERLSKKIDGVEGKVDDVKDLVKEVLGVVDNISGRLEDMKKSTASALDHARLEDRVEALEQKAGELTTGKRR